MLGKVRCIQNIVCVCVCVVLFDLPNIQYTVSLFSCLGPRFIKQGECSQVNQITNPGTILSAAAATETKQTQCSENSKLIGTVLTPFLMVGLCQSVRRVLFILCK